MALRAPGGHTMIDLVLKRHEGPGWQVFTELANATGGRASRRADALAIGLWPSHRYEVHGYEFKESRGDVRRELQDITKSHAVGRYCDYWHLVVADLAIIDGLLIPPTWGILFPRARVLRVHRKASKRKAEPIGRAFVAAMLQNVQRTWVSKTIHHGVVSRLNELERERSPQEQRDGAHMASGPKWDLERLRDRVRQFETASGVSISDSSVWEFGHIGKAVRVVLDAQLHRSRTQLFVNEAHGIAEHFRNMADRTHAEADAMAKVLEELDAQKEAASQQDPAPAVAPAPQGADAAAAHDPEPVQAP